MSQYEKSIVLMKSEKEKVFGIYIPEKLEETSKMEVARNGHTLKGKEIK